MSASARSASKTRGRTCTGVLVRVLERSPQRLPWRSAIGIAPQMRDAEIVKLAVMQALLATGAARPGPGVSAGRASAPAVVRGGGRRPPHLALWASTTFPIGAIGAVTSIAPSEPMA
jgi:hypothetical protein